MRESSIAKGGATSRQEAVADSARIFQKHRVVAGDRPAGGRPRHSGHASTTTSIVSGFPSPLSQGRLYSRSNGPVPMRLAVNSNS